MYCLHLLTLAAVFGFLAAATPIPPIETSLYVLQARNCNDVYYLLFNEQSNGDLVPKEGTVHISHAANATRTAVLGADHTTSTDAEDDHSDGPDIEPKNESDGDRYPEAFLEGDSDSGGESDVGNTAVSVANGLTGNGGAGSAALNSVTSGSTTSFCSLLACTSAAQSDGKVSTTATGARINVTSPHINVTGPIVVVAISSPGARR